MFSSRRFGFVLLTVMLAASASAQTRLAYDGGWTDTASGDAIVSLPEGYDAAPDRDWPLLLFLHGDLWTN